MTKTKKTTKKRKKAKTQSFIPTVQKKVSNTTLISNPILNPKKNLNLPQSTKKDADAEIDDSISPGDPGETPKSEVQNKDEVRAKDSPNTDTPNDQINKVLAAQEQEVDHETES